jgi:uncharacterized membrane protein YdjX (TVP38/TMEM64 family)
VPWRAILVAAVVVTAIVVARATPLGRRTFSEHAIDDLADSSWAAPALVALYTIMFGLGIPGSALFVAAGFVFRPPVACALGILGGTLGSLIAYFTGRVLGAEARERWRRRPGFAVVERSLDFTGLLALRLLPAFPHSVVNFGAGIAGATPAAFTGATVIGLGVKAYVYANVVHKLKGAPGLRDFFSLDAWGLLLGLAALSVLAKLAIRRRT